MSRASYLTGILLLGASMGFLLTTSLWGWFYSCNKFGYEQRIQRLEEEKAELIKRIPKPSMLEALPATQPAPKLLQ